MTLLFGIIIGAFVGITMVALVSGNKYEDSYKDGYAHGYVDGFWKGVKKDENIDRNTLHG